jgi:hypothetical protein
MENMPLCFLQGKPDLTLLAQRRRKKLSITQRVCMLIECNEEPFAAQK